MVKTKRQRQEETSERQRGLGLEVLTFVADHPRWTHTSLSVHLDQHHQKGDIEIVLQNLFFHDYVTTTIAGYVAITEAGRAYLRDSTRVRDPKPVSRITGMNHD